MQRFARRAILYIFSEAVCDCGAAGDTKMYVWEGTRVSRYFSMGKCSCAAMSITMRLRLPVWGNRNRLDTEVFR